MTFEEIGRRIEEGLGAGTQAQVQGMPGTTPDHVSALVVSPAFEGISMVEAHRKVMGLFGAEIASNELHAFNLRTFSPSQWQNQGQRISLSGK